MIWLKLCDRLGYLSVRKFFPSGSLAKLHAWRPHRLASSPSTQFRGLATQVSTKTNDVLLYKYDNPRFYKYLNLFALVQFFFWTYIAHYSVRSLRDTPPTAETDEKEALPWWKTVNLGEAKYKNSLAAICYFFGGSILACSWLFTLRSVRYLVLNKGGQNVSLVTYAPFGENRIYTIPLDKVSCVASRTGAQWTLPIRVYGHKFYYLLDMNGQFRHVDLFDKTAGVQRKF